MTNKEAAQQIAQGAGQSIEDDIDFICGTWPGPRPWWLVTQVASDVTFTASTLSDGALRNELVHVAGKLLDKAAAQGGAQRLQSAA
jgi:hypothetical protein